MELYYTKEALESVIADWPTRCPHCSEYDTFDWHPLKQYRCVSCGTHIENEER